jgi:hypothetical protein
MFKNIDTETLKYFFNKNEEMNLKIKKTFEELKK